MKNDDTLDYHRVMLDGLMDLHESIDLFLVSQDFASLPDSARQKLKSLKPVVAELAEATLREFLKIGE